MLALLWVALQTTATVAEAPDLPSPEDAAAGLRAALDQGIDTAVARLGVSDGFLKNPSATIPLPPALQKVEHGLRRLGRGKDADALKLAINHAAESAAVTAGPLLKQALGSMSLEDANAILSGGDDAGTQYFKRTTSGSLTEKFKPIVADAIARFKVSALYEKYAGEAAAMGLLRNEDARLDDYLTDQALAGLYTAMADEERAIRNDPSGQTNALIRKAFGARQQ